MSTHVASFLPDKVQLQEEQRFDLIWTCVLCRNVHHGKIERVINSDIFFFQLIVVLSGGGDFLLKVWSVLDGSCPVTMKGHIKCKLLALFIHNRCYGHASSRRNIPN